MNDSRERAKLSQVPDLMGGPTASENRHQGANISLGLAVETMDRRSMQA
jgi:hypothetical protein